MLYLIPFALMGRKFKGAKIEGNKVYNISNLTNLGEGMVKALHLFVHYQLVH